MADGVHGRRGPHHHQPPARRRVLVFPLPFQGHIDPMMHLAGVLHGRGLAVTVLHTCFNALSAARHPEFRFTEVPDGVPAGVAGEGRIIDIILAMNAAMEASAAVRDALASVLAEDDDGDEEEGQPAARPHVAACLIIDSNLLAVQRAADALGLPTMVLRTGSAACLRCFLAYPMLHEKGYLPPRESQLYTPVRELPPLRVKDLFFSKISSHEKVREVLARTIETVKNCSGLIINTFEALETTELERLRGELDLPLLLTAGPLHKLSSRSTGSSLLDQDYNCIKWLDTQPSGSVLYVSFGSLAAMDSNEFLEVAWGLANSGHPFLWVIRPKLVRDCENVGLPDGFQDAVEGKGMVIQWAPQQEVLAHRAVGGFWTHNGWNSTLESISEGIPMICRPDTVDQMMNARYVQEIWGVGLELDGELERGKIKKAIRMLMDEKEGAHIRERAKVLRRKVADSLESSGSSRIAIDKSVASSGRRPAAASGNGGRVARGGGPGGPRSPARAADPVELSRAAAAAARARVRRRRSLRGQARRSSSWGAATTGSGAPRGSAPRTRSDGSRGSEAAQSPAANGGFHQGRTQRGRGYSLARVDLRRISAGPAPRLHFGRAGLSSLPVLRLLRLLLSDSASTISGGGPHQGQSLCSSHSHSSVACHSSGQVHQFLFYCSCCLDENK